MKDFDPATLFAIAEALLGSWLWVALAGAGLVAVLWLVVLFRHAASLRRVCRAVVLLMIAAAVAVAALAPALTDAAFSDLNGTIDYAMLALVAILCGLAAGVAVWPVAALLRGGATPQR